MATWMVHLRIAENLLSLIAGLDETHFSIGNVAPDSGVPDESWETFTPPPEVSHYGAQDDAILELADLEFYREYLSPIGGPRVGSKRFSFLLGYFFHLIIDNLWSQEIGAPTRLGFADEFDTDPKFIWEVKRDWYGLDFAYARRHPDSIFWRVFLHAVYKEDYLDFLPREAIQSRLDYIKELYKRTDEEIENRYGNRPDKYLSQDAMESFIKMASRLLHESYVYLWKHGRRINGYDSILEIVQIGTSTGS